MVKENKKNLFFYLLVFSIFTNVLIVIQAEEPVQLISRRVLFFFEAVKTGKEQQADLLLLYDALLIKLTQECHTAIFFEAPAGTHVPATDAEKAKLTAGADCDAWLAVTLTPARRDAGAAASFSQAAIKGQAGNSEFTTTRPQLRLQVCSYDLALKQEVIRLEVKAADSKNLERTFGDMLVQAINRSYKKIKQEEADTSYPLPGNCQLSIKARPGTVITGLNTTPLIVDETGETSLELARNRTYTLQANCPGYFPLTETLYPVTNTKSHTLRQQRSSRW
jgi:hypothetical protein